MSKEEFIHTVLPLRRELEGYAFSFLRNKDEIDDIMQEVYVKLWCMRDKLSEYNSINALSFVITKNMCINKINARKQQYSYDAAYESKSNEQQPDVALMEKDDLATALNIVDQLPSLQQAILKMRHLEGLEISEIVELTGCAEGAVRTNLSRARNRVKTLFMEINGNEK